MSAETGVFPASGEFNLEIEWKMPLGKGYSGVAVSEGTVVTMFSDGATDWVIAFDDLTGANRWRFAIGETYRGHDGSDDGPISTPLVVGERVFCLGPKGTFYALNFATGKALWAKNLVVDLASTAPYYGFATSALFHRGVLVLQTGSPSAGISGFNHVTGERIWSVGGGGAMYQSPVALSWNGGGYVAAADNRRVCAIDAATGAVSWQFVHKGRGLRGAASLVPVEAGEGRMFLTHDDNTSLLLEYEKDGNHVTPQVRWTNRAIRNSYNVPVYSEGYLYGFSTRILTCLEATSGRIAWRSRGTGDGFVILVDGHLVVAGKTGKVIIVRATHEGYHQVTSLSVFDDLVWTDPSFANGYIYVRSMGEIAKLKVVEGTKDHRTSERVAIADAESPFARFLSAVQSSEEKASLVDQFMAVQKAFPIVEDDHTVHFVFRGSGEDVALEGDLFGARRDSPMTRVAGTDLFYLTIHLESDARINYMFQIDYQDIVDPRNPRRTRTAIYGPAMELSLGRSDDLEMSWFAMPRWDPPNHLERSDVETAGRLESHELMRKASSTKHAISVYLPVNYDKDGRRYPVCYFHGGEDAISRGEIPRSLDKLIGSRIEPLIAVFVHRAIKPFHGPGDYARMFFEQVVPLIDRTYRTVASARARASIGAGFSGATAFYCAFLHPDKIANVGAQSPFLFREMKEAIERSFPDAKQTPLRIYLEWGKYDFRSPHEGWDQSAESRKLDQQLRKRGYAPIGGEQHDGTGWSSWRNRTDAMLETFFPISRGAERD